ncbi:unnamed protein product [Leptidea sinapis]|uniref:Uncharacterized protein n=1 Tax=Leptidea sinapis TaxID=189913 RepID=A0A5E4QVT6_9NEOP|nr:unnamed protein product [Leptidea sinapis]
MSYKETDLRTSSALQNKNKSKTYSSCPNDSSQPMKRDVAESFKNAWNGVVKTLSDAGDAVVHVFKPTEKSVIDKMASGLKDLIE